MTILVSLGYHFEAARAEGFLLSALVVSTPPATKFMDWANRIVAEAFLTIPRAIVLTALLPEGNKTRTT